MLKEPKEPTRLELSDTHARQILVAQKAVLGLQNEGHRIQQQAQAALAQCAQREQAAQKAYAEVIQRIKAEMGCTGTFDDAALCFVEQDSRN